MAVVPLNRVSVQGEPLEIITYAHSYNDNNVPQQQGPWEFWATGNRRLDVSPQNGSLKLEHWDVNPLQDETTGKLVAAAQVCSSSPTKAPVGYATFDSYV